MKGCVFLFGLLLAWACSGPFGGARLLAQTPTRSPEQTLTPEETHSEWEQLAKKYPKLCTVANAGRTDCGLSLQAAVLGQNQKPVPLQERKQPVLMIMNAIHPGEPCGVDASLNWAKRLLENNDPLLKQMTIVVIPFYNLGGGLNRGCCSRANQIGPEEQGFRGNARNLDLNRDFTKADSRNTQSFYKLFHKWDPDLFIDTHTTNGADYVYPITLIPTQPDKLGGELGAWLRAELLPALYSGMAKTETPMCPYVNTRGRTPETGLVDFLETPRYSTGYAALFQAVGFVSEAHMLKPYSVRVKATENLIDLIARQGQSRSPQLLEHRRNTREAQRRQDALPIRWALDTTRFDLIEFKGYKARKKPSEVTGQPRLWYDTNSPQTDSIRYYNRYTVVDSATKPYAYVVPQAWHEVIDRLRMSGVKLRFLAQNASLPVEVAYIEHYSSPHNPYEGHYLHDTIRVRREEAVIAYRLGDAIVETGHPYDRFVMEVLEAEAPDSYLAWNFFDAVLMQKEWFSDYLFEDTAAAMLRRDPDLQRALDSARTADPVLYASPFQQLYFIYKRSKYYEKTHLRYPVGKLYMPVAFPYYEDLRLED